METRNEGLYARAKDRYIHHATEQDLLQAREMFAQLGDHPGARAYAERCDTLLRYQVGNTVDFGSLEGKPIRWRVLDERGKLRLLFAEDIVAERAYNDTPVDTSWRDCTLRKWLNGEFLEEAFTAKERMSIISGMVRNPRSAKWFTNGGFDSMDKLFVLNEEEFARYLPDPSDRAKGRWWWLRTPGSNLMSAIGVYEDGTAYDFGINVYYKEGRRAPGNVGAAAGVKVGNEFFGRKVCGERGVFEN